MRSSNNIGATDDWRNYFPGIFSSLYAITSKARQRGSGIQSLSMIAILELSLLVSLDCEPDNSYFLQQLGLLTSKTPTSNDPNVRFSQFMQKIKSSLGHPPVESADEQSVDIFDPPGSFFSDVSKFASWRADLMQHLESLIPKAYR